LDNDCDATTDEGVKNTYYRDADGDTYGNISNTAQACSVPAGYVSDSTDCNDGDAFVHPGALELCNAVNDDCKRRHLGRLKRGLVRDACDGADSDLCQEGGYQCTSGAQTCSDVTGDSVEVCDGLDNDCDATTDEGVKNTYYRTRTADTYGNISNTAQACSVPAGYVSDSTDCNDGDALVHPGALELCNAVTTTVTPAPRTAQARIGSGMPATAPTRTCARRVGTSVQAEHRPAPMLPEIVSRYATDWTTTATRLPMRE